MSLKKLCFPHTMENYVICLRFLWRKYGNLLTRLVKNGDYMETEWRVILLMEILW